MSPRHAQIEKLLAKDPGDPFLLYALGQERAKAGDHAGAIEVFDRAAKAEPPMLYAFFFKAKSLAALGRVEEARGAVSEGQRAAAMAGDAKASNELAGLAFELEAL